MIGRERQSRSRNPKICSAAGLQYSSTPSPSMVTMPVGMLRSTSAASSRTWRSSPANASRSAPMTDTRLAKYAVTAATDANSASWMAVSGVAVVWWPKNTSAKYTMPASSVTRPVLAGGISTALTAISGTYKEVKSLCGPPVMCTTAVMSAVSNSTWLYRKVRPGRRFRIWVCQ